MKARVITSVAADGALVVGDCSRKQSLITSSAVARRQSSFSVSSVPCSLIGIGIAASPYFTSSHDPTHDLIDATKRPNIAAEIPPAAISWADSPRNTTRKSSARFTSAIVNGAARKRAAITRVSTTNNDGFTIGAHTVITDASGIATFRQSRSGSMTTVSAFDGSVSEKF
jgi:hypothetical protein